MFWVGGVHPRVNYGHVHCNVSYLGQLDNPRIRPVPRLVYRLSHNLLYSHFPLFSFHNDMIDLFLVSGNFRDSQATRGPTP